MKTSLGQCLDLHSSKHGKKPILSKFTMDRYNAIVKYKTAYYSFYLPVAIAMRMVRVSWKSFFWIGIILIRFYDYEGAYIYDKRLPEDFFYLFYLKMK